MQLRAAVVAVSLLIPSVALADGEVALRGAYYKERSTRVTQPMVDANFEVGDGGTLDTHLLLDVITSASSAAGAVGESFDEHRVEVGGNYLHRIGDFGVGFGVRLSQEPDYTSRFVSVRGLAGLGQNNTTLGVGFAFGSDDISNSSQQGEIGGVFRDELSTTLASASLLQLLSPTLSAQVTYDFIYLSGYQANPYRLVAAGGFLVPERVPEKRYRNAMFGSLRAFVPPSKTTIITGYRFYVDDWGVVGHTPELRLIQQIVTNLSVHGRYRFYRQSAADFYKQVYDSADPMDQEFLTRDEKLGDIITHTLGLKLDVGMSVFGIEGKGGRVRTELLFEYIDQNTTFGNAVNIQFAVAVPFDY